MSVANRFRFAVFGLGNPGSQFVGTRHNVGFSVVERLASELRAEWHDGSTAQCVYATHDGPHVRTWRKRQDATPESEAAGDACVLYLAKPQTFMNRSGLAVRAFADRFHVPHRNILVVVDDINLPLGKLRLRQTGSSGGQKGLESIARHLDSDRFDRLKLGVGRQPGDNAADYVLSRFPSHERELVDDTLRLATSAIAVWLEHGCLAAMNRYN